MFLSWASQINMSLSRWAPQQTVWLLLLQKATKKRQKNKSLQRGFEEWCKKQLVRVGERVVRASFIAGKENQGASF